MQLQSQLSYQYKAFIAMGAAGLILILSWSWYTCCLFCLTSPRWGPCWGSLDYPPQLTGPWLGSWPHWTSVDKQPEIERIEPSNMFKHWQVHNQLLTYLFIWQESNVKVTVHLDVAGAAADSWHHDDPSFLPLKFLHWPHLELQPIHRERFRS